MVLLASIIVYAEALLGPTALAMMVALFFLYLYLLRELVTSQERAEELGRRGEQLASLQVGVLTAMLRTLSMRDQMTARHSAAVARYTREIAKAAGLSEDEQDLAHTAGLLHDIGKFILRDHILLANTKLDDDDWQTIRMHPYQGSRVVREVEGYGPVADIIWCHHERIDGKGYPARDRRRRHPADLADDLDRRHLRRDDVARLLPRPGLLAGGDRGAAARQRQPARRRARRDLHQGPRDKGVAFRHADDADFEAELAFEKRVRDHAAPRSEPLPAAA
jgi:putative nucleotidyltransferase with HDIG domain